MGAQANAGFMLGMLRMIETRELDKLPACYHPDVEFHWSPGLPYGGRHAGPAALAAAETFQAVWGPLQPSSGLRRMDPGVVGTGPGGRVVVRCTWRSEAPGAGRHEAETLAEYRIRDGRLAFLRRAGVAAA